MAYDENEYAISSKKRAELTMTRETRSKTHYAKDDCQPLPSPHANNSHRGKRRYSQIPHGCGLKSYAVTQSPKRLSSASASVGNCIRPTLNVPVHSCVLTVGCA